MASKSKRTTTKPAMQQQNSTSSFWGAFYSDDENYNNNNNNANEKFNNGDEGIMYHQTNNNNNPAAVSPSAFAPPAPKSTRTASQYQSLFIECQVNMLRQKDSPSVVSNILDTFLDMKLSKNLTMREAFCNTSICHELTLMIKETPTEGERNDDTSGDDGEYEYEEEDHEVIIRKGFQLIRDLIYNDSSSLFLQQFAVNGTIETVSRRMKEFKKNEALQEDAFMVLFYISFADFDEDHNNISEVFNERVLTILCDTMKLYPKNRHLQMSSLSFLRMIAFKNQATILDIIMKRCQFLEVVFKVLKLNWKNTKLVTVGCELLKLLLRHNPSEEVRIRVRKLKGTLLLAQIEDHYRASSSKDHVSIANLAVDVFWVVCNKNNKNYFKALDFGANGDEANGTGTINYNNYFDKKNGKKGSNKKTTSNTNSKANGNAPVDHNNVLNNKNGIRKVDKVTGDRRGGGGFDDRRGGMPNNNINMKERGLKSSNYQGDSIVLSRKTRGRHKSEAVCTTGAITAQELSSKNDPSSGEERIGNIGILPGTRREKQEPEGSSDMGSNEPVTNEVFTNEMSNGQKGKHLGVSVYHLSAIFRPAAREYARRKHGDSKDAAEITIYDIENLKEDTGFIREKGEKVRCKEDKQMKASYVGSISGKDHVGVATHMLSYSWGNTIDDIVESLVEFCNINQLDLKRTYIWMCCLCLNQHRVKERMNKGESLPYGELTIIVARERIMQIKNVLSLMVPWNKPVCLNRVWCVYETFTAIEEKCNLTIIMPTGEKDKLIDAIKTTETNDLLDASCKTRIEESEASQQEDLENILHLVNSGPSATYVNSRVNGYLREWMEETMLETVKSAEKYSKDMNTDVELADLYHGIGNVYNNKKGDYDEALEFYEKCLNIRQEVYGADHINIADIYCNIGVVHYNQGDNEEALDSYNKCLPIYKKVYGPKHPKTADTYNNIGLVYKKKGDYNKALEYYNLCLPIRLELYPPEHQETADTYYNIGNVYARKGDYEKALVYYNICLPIYVKVFGEEHAKAADTYYNFGNVYARKADYKQALKYYNICLPIYREVYGPQHSVTADTYYNIGCVYIIVDEYDKALECFRKCFTIYDEVYGPQEHAKTVDAMDKINLVKKMKKEKGSLSQ